MNKAFDEYIQKEQGKMKEILFIYGLAQDYDNLTLKQKIQVEGFLSCRSSGFYELSSSERVVEFLKSFMSKEIFEKCKVAGKYARSDGVNFVYKDLFKLNVSFTHDKMMILYSTVKDYSYNEYAYYSEETMKERCTLYFEAFPQHIDKYVLLDNMFSESSVKSYKNHLEYAFKYIGGKNKLDKIIKYSKLYMNGIIRKDYNRMNVNIRERAERKESAILRNDNFLQVKMEFEEIIKNDVKMFEELGYEISNFFSYSF